MVGRLKKTDRRHGLKKTDRRKIGRLKSYKSRDNTRWSCVRIWHLSQYFWASEKTQGSRRGTYKIQKDWIIKISEQSQGENKKQKDWIRWIQQRRFQGESRYKNGLKTKAEKGGKGGGRQTRSCINANKIFALAHATCKCASLCMAAAAQTNRRLWLNMYSIDLVVKYKNGTT